MAEVLWRPPVDRIESSQMRVFRDFARDRGAAVGDDYPALWQWSVEHRAEFWSLVWDFFDVIGDKGDVVVHHADEMFESRWFPEASLNFAENLLRHVGESSALVEHPEGQPRSSMSRDELLGEVGKCQRVLRNCGVGVGDRVGAYMPNCIETVVAMLATTSLGAVWSSCSPDFGVGAAKDRLGQIEPKVLVAAEAYHYAGKLRPVVDRALQLYRDIDSAKHLLLVRRSEELDVGDVDGASLWDEALESVEAGAPEFVRLAFDHPVYILFSSGTTGLPKGIVHGAGGTLLQHLKELGLHTDLSDGRRLAYYTTCGWMMWNWLVSGLALGVGVHLIDGSPFHPTEDRLFRIAADEKLDALGVSAKYLALAEKHGLQPGRSLDLGALRTLLSTGSPLSPESFDYVYREVKADLQVASLSGGTDIVSCFALGVPIQPVRRGELQGAGLGMSVEVFDATGRSLEAGATGELVCTRSFPSMPVSFWADPDRERYRRAYFERFPGVWHHGDWVEVTESGGMIFHGRSDTTLNPGGVRIGTAEIYRAVEGLDEVLESVCVGQRFEEDVRVVLFVVLRGGAVLDADLENRIRRRVREGASPHHVPRRILRVGDVPRTVSGKISEIAVQKTIHGEELDNRDALANPECLSEYANREELA